MMNAKSIHPFMGVEFDKTVGDFRVITYQAYNAFGLIGPEKNGIAILNEKNRSVVMDEHMRQNSGYYGVGQKVIDEAEKLCYMIENDFNKFVQFVNSNPRARYQIS